MHTKKASQLHVRLLLALISRAFQDGLFISRVSLSLNNLIIRKRHNYQKVKIRNKTFNHEALLMSNVVIIILIGSCWCLEHKICWIYDIPSCIAADSRVFHPCITGTHKQTLESS